MSIEVADEFNISLNSGCSHSLERILDKKRPQDFNELQRIVSETPKCKDKNKLKRAIHLLGHWGNTLAVPALRTNLNEFDESETAVVIDALGRLGTEDCLISILDYSHHASPHVRKFVVRALARIHDPRAYQKLEEIAASDPTDWVRACAKKLLNDDLKKS